MIAKEHERKMLPLSDFKLAYFYNERLSQFRENATTANLGSWLESFNRCDLMNKRAKSIENNRVGIKQRLSLGV